MENIEIEGLKFQLNQVKEALKKDEKNTDLITLQDNIEEMISILLSTSGRGSTGTATTTGVSGTAGGTATTTGVSGTAGGGGNTTGVSGKGSTSGTGVSGTTTGGKVTGGNTNKSDRIQERRIGSMVNAKWTNGRFYEAKIVDSLKDAYKVIFTGYDQIQVVKKSHCKDHTPIGTSIVNSTLSTDGSNGGSGVSTGGTAGSTLSTAGSIGGTIAVVGVSGVSNSATAAAAVGVSTGVSTGGSASEAGGSIGMDKVKVHQESATTTIPIDTNQRETIPKIPNPKKTGDKDKKKRKVPVETRKRDEWLKFNKKIKK